MRFMKTIELLILVSAYGVITFVSLSHPAFRPNAGFESGNFDHFIAYLLLGTLTSCFSVHGLQTRWLIFILPMYAGLMELGQLLVPGRQATVETFFASAIGAWIGLLVGKGVRRLARQYLVG